MKKIIFAFILSIAVTPAYADLSLNAFKQLSAGKKLEKTSVEMYVGGVVKGYLNANAFLGESPIFCFSGDIDTGAAYKLASEVVKERLAKSPEDGNKEIVELLLLLKLKSLYPCQQ